MTITAKPGSLRKALIAGLAAGGILAATAAQAQLKPVKIGVGGAPVLNLSYFYVLLPQILGYWKEEGYDGKVFPVSGSSESVQQLSVDNLDLALMNVTAIIQSNAQYNLPIRGVITNTVMGWGIAVRKGGPIKTPADLKGKTVGIVSLSSGGIPLFKSYLKKNGLAEDDVSLVATGVGAPAMTALQAGRVQGLLYWGSALTGFRTAGLDFDVLRDPAWLRLPDYGVAVLERKIKNDPAMVAGIGRGIAKAMVFAAANPDCVRKLQWTHFPDTKPTGVSEETARANDLALLDTALEEQRLAIALNPGNVVAGTSTSGYAALQDLLFETGVIAKKIDPAILSVNDEALAKRMNDFDKAAIVAQAKACKGVG